MIRGQENLRVTKNESPAVPWAIKRERTSPNKTAVQTWRRKPKPLKPYSGEQSLRRGLGDETRSRRRARIGENLDTRGRNMTTRKQGKLIGRVLIRDQTAAEEPERARTNDVWRKKIMASEKKKMSRRNAKQPEQKREGGLPRADLEEGRRRTRVNQQRYLTVQKQRFGGETRNQTSCPPCRPGKR